MKLPHLSGLLAILLIAGCATEIQTKENLLTSSGFKVKPAATADQIEKLRALPPNKITCVSHQGHLFFVFPDASQNLLYVGRKAEYAAYEKLRDEKKLAAEESTAARFNQEEKWADLDGWKGLSDGWYNF